MSEIRSEDKEMYSEAYSLQDMRGVVHKIADLKSPTKNWKDRVTAAARALGFSWSRTKDFYYGDARTVLDHEGRRGRATLRELQARKKANEQAIQLHQTAAYLRQIDPDMHGPTIAALECAAAEAGVLDRPLAEPEGEG